MKQRPYDGYLAYALGDPKNPSKERVSGEGKKPHQAVSQAAANFHKRFGRVPAKVTTAFGFHYGMPWKLT